MKKSQNLAAVITVEAVMLLVGSTTPARAATFDISGMFDSRVFPGSNLQNGSFNGVFSFNDTTGQPLQDFVLNLVTANNTTFYTFSPSLGSFQILNPSQGTFTLSFTGSTPTTPNLPTLQLSFAENALPLPTSTFKSGYLTDPINMTRSVVSASITLPQRVPEPDMVVGTVVLGGISWLMKRQLKALVRNHEPQINTDEHR